MVNFGPWLPVAGAVMLVAAIAAYLKDSSRQAFPIILAIGGVFLISANRISANIPGVGNIEVTREIVQASDVNGKALLAQQAAIDALGKDLALLRGEFTSYQNNSNQRFAALDAKPVDVPKIGQDQSAMELSRTLGAARASRDPVERANRELGKAIDKMF